MNDKKMNYRVQNYESIPGLGRKALRWLELGKDSHHKKVTFHTLINDFLSSALIEDDGVTLSLKETENKDQRTRKVEITAPSLRNKVIKEMTAGGIKKDDDSVIIKNPLNEGEETAGRETFPNDESFKKYTSDILNLLNKYSERGRDLEEVRKKVSHDLQAPVDNIFQLVRWLKDDCYGELDEKSRNKIDMILDKSDELLSLIGEIKRELKDIVSFFEDKSGEGEI